nr:MAG: internal scaffolding protein [Microvirus sp.]
MSKKASAVEDHTKRARYVQRRIRVTNHTPWENRMAKSEYKDMVSISGILKKYNMEQLMQLNQRMGYIDTTEFDTNNLEKYVDQHRTLKNRFDELPANIRSMFENNEFQFLHWIKDPKNHDEARALKIMPQVKETVSHPPVQKEKVGEPSGAEKKPPQ